MRTMTQNRTTILNGLIIKHTFITQMCFVKDLPEIKQPSNQDDKNGNKISKAKTTQKEE